jgi:hypothetical protein
MITAGSENQGGVRGSAGRCKEQRIRGSEGQQRQRTRGSEDQRVSRAVRGLRITAERPESLIGGFEDQGGQRTSRAVQGT